MADPGAMAPQIRVRSGTAEDVAPAGRLASQAFSAASVGEPVREPPAEGDPAPWANPLPRLDLVAEHEGKIVGTASAVLRGQWFGGRRMLCAAIGGVAVGVEARGLGVGRALMNSLQAAARDAGAVSSALIPSSHGFYTSVGYGVAGRRPVYALSTVELRELPAPRPDGMLLRKTAPADADGVAELVRLRAARGSGLLDHRGPDPSTIDDPTGSDSYVVDIEGAVAGWCLLNRREPSSVRAHYDLEVSDLVAEDPAVELVLWRLLVGDYPSALRAQAVVGPGSLIEHHLERQQDIVEDSSWMLRLLEVDRALAARGYPTDVTAELILAVQDVACSWNDGTRRLSVADGSCVVLPAPGATPDAVITASTLASVFSAHLDPLQAQHQGRLQVRNERVVTTLRALFAGPAATLARAF